MDLADQQAEMDGLSRQLHARHAASASTAQELEQLRRDNDELKLYLVATLRLLAAKGVATADDIKAMVAAVDREDGSEDERYTGDMTPGPRPQKSG
jgi:hypothetical protein